MSDSLDAGLTLAQRFLGSRDTRSLRLLVLAILVIGGLWMLYACGRFEPLIPAPFARADEVREIRSKLDEQGKQIGNLEKFQIATQLLASYQILCERVTHAMRAQEQDRINELQASYRAVNGGNKYEPPPCQ